MINLAGKKGVIMGVANELSIAWGIAKQLSENGAELCCTYQGDALFQRVKPLAESIQNNFIIECNVLNESSVKNTFNQVRERWNKIDFVLHSIAFSDKNELKGKYLNLSLIHI